MPDRSSSTAICSSSGSSGSTVIPRRGFRTLAALADVADAGVPVMMIAGNHDCWGGDVLREDVGVDYRFGPWLGDIAGWHTRIEHGDGLAPARRQALSRAASACSAIRWRFARFAGCIPTSRRRSRRTARTPVARIARARRRPRAARRGDRAPPTPIDRSTLIVVRPLARRHARALAERRRSTAIRARGSTRRRFLRITERANRAAPVGRISRECGSPRLRSFRRESADLAAGTAADRRTR